MAAFSLRPLAAASISLEETLPTHRVAAQQFHAAGLKHEFEQEQPQQLKHEPRRCGVELSCAATGPEPRWGEADSEEARFQ